MTSGHAEEYFTDLPKRIAEVEKFIAQQGTTIAKVVDVQADTLKRLEKLEALAQMRAITEAREDERDKALYARLDRMELKIGAIEGIGSKALWVFISTIIVAGATFMIKGGLVG